MNEYDDEDNFASAASFSAYGEVNDDNDEEDELEVKCYYFVLVCLP